MEPQRNKNHIKYLPLLLAALLCLTACGQAAALSDAPELAETRAAAPSAAPAPAEAPAVPAETPAPVEDDPAPPAETDAGPPPEETEPPYTGPDLTEQPAVDDSFFADAAFFGNSLVRGLELYGGITQGDFRALKSAAVYNAAVTKNAAMADGTPATLLETLFQKQYGKIYVLFGVNEIGWDTSRFLPPYGELLDLIAQQEPDAEIYIMSLTPVTEWKDAQGFPFTAERVREYNTALWAMAEERGFWYVDLVDALADEDGFLPAVESTDGIHLTQETYPKWADYLRTHYAP